MVVLAAVVVEGAEPVENTLPSRALVEELKSTLFSFFCTLANASPSSLFPSLSLFAIIIIALLLCFGGVIICVPLATNSGSSEYKRCGERRILFIFIGLALSKLKRSLRPWPKVVVGLADVEVMGSLEGERERRGVVVVIGCWVSEEVVWWFVARG